jgi:hypothetical protein
MRNVHRHTRYGIEKKTVKVGHTHFVQTPILYLFIRAYFFTNIYFANRRSTQG